MSWILYKSLEGGESFPLASFQGQFDGTTTSRPPFAWKMAATSSQCWILGAMGGTWGEISCSPTLEGFMEPFTLDEADTKGVFGVPEKGDGVCDTSLPGCTDPTP